MATAITTEATYPHKDFRILPISIAYIKTTQKSRVFIGD
jgi:hypothetical protein